MKQREEFNAKTKAGLDASLTVPDLYVDEIQRLEDGAFYLMTLDPQLRRYYRRKEID